MSMDRQIAKVNVHQILMFMYTNKVGSLSKYYGVDCSTNEVFLAEKNAEIELCVQKEFCKHLMHWNR